MESTWTSAETVIIMVMVSMENIADMVTDVNTNMAMDVNNLHDKLEDKQKYKEC